MSDDPITWFAQFYDRGRNSLTVERVYAAGDGEEQSRISFMYIIGGETTYLRVVPNEELRGFCSRGINYNPEVLIEALKDSEATISHHESGSSVTSVTVKWILPITAKRNGVFEIDIPLQGSTVEQKASREICCKDMLQDLASISGKLEHLTSCLLKRVELLESKVEGLHRGSPHCNSSYEYQDLLEPVSVVVRNTDSCDPLKARIAEASEF